MASAQTPMNWRVQGRDPEAEGRLARELGVPSLVAALLVQRGYADPAAASKFLDPKLEELFDPRLLPDYVPASEAILGARERKELIYVHGDYDVDGVTSAALFSRFLAAIGCNVKTHVPHRMREGYGIHRSAVEAAKNEGAKLFLTCDCGISAHEQVAMANEAGMKVVVTDHHSIGADLPAAVAIVNPHRQDSQYPFDELSGVGVVFKLCDGINRELGNDPKNYYRAFLDLAALGTIADVMPLVSENRIIAKFGLERLAETKKVGLQALMREANIVPGAGRSLRAYHVGFIIGPRLNAAGRIDDAALALQLLLENDLEAATAQARRIEEVNTAPNFNLAEAIRAFPELFISGGGHAMAAGCSFRFENIDRIRQSLHEYAGERLTPDDFLVTMTADMEIDFDEISMASAEAIERLEPFGCANPTPVFVAKNITLAQVIPTKSPQHARLSLRSGESASKDGIAFGIGERLAATGAGAVVDLMVQPAVEEWRGNRSLKIHVKDYQLAN
jgi:single-stranded DNA-specific DHH superfamily exonuclease